MKKTTGAALRLGCALIAIALLAAPILSPDGAARGAIVVCDEVDVEPVVVPAITIDGSAAPEPRPVLLRLRGEELRHFRSLLEVEDGHGAACACEGDYHLRLRRWHVPLASFRAHLRETPAHLNGSFGILSLNASKSHQLNSYLAALLRVEARSVESNPA